MFFSLGKWSESRSRNTHGQQIQNHRLKLQLGQDLKKKIKTPFGKRFEKKTYLEHYNIERAQCRQAVFEIIIITILIITKKLGCVTNSTEMYNSPSGWSM